MTTPAAAHEAMHQQFVDVWSAATAAHGYPYTFEGEPFTPPSDTPWCRFTVRPVLSQQYSLGPTGARKYRRVGNAFAQIFIPVHQGTQLAVELAQAVSDGFEGVSITDTDLVFDSASIRIPGVDGAWLMAMVDIAFRFIETK